MKTRDYTRDYIHSKTHLTLTPFAASNGTPNRTKPPTWLPTLSQASQWSDVGEGGGDVWLLVVQDSTLLGELEWYGVCGVEDGSEDEC